MSEGLLEELVTALRCLPGVGPKSARRMAFHLLQRDREGGRRLGSTLATAMNDIGHCARCRTFTEDEVCATCRNPKRDATVLCIVENPSDVSAIEAGTDYQGLYLVLMGNLSPLDGIGPRELGLDGLGERLAADGIREVILATSSTVEGEATAHYIGELCRARGLNATRIAHGIPLGGELEFVDSGTLAHAFSGRTEIS